MEDDGIGRAGHLVPRMEPPVAQLAVFGRHTEILVKAADPAKQAGRDGDVVGGKKAGALGITVVVDVRDVDDELTGYGAEIVGESVDSAAANESIRSFRMLCRQFTQPVGRWLAVVVGESEKSTPCHLGACVSCSAGSLLRLVNKREIQTARVREKRPIQGLGTTVVNDDHLIVAPLEVELGERPHAAHQLRGAGVGGYDDRDLYHGFIYSLPAPGYLR